MKQLYCKLRSNTIVWDSVTTTIWSIVGKGSGFLVPFFIAAWFGVSSRTDAFFFAYSIVIFLSGFFAPVVESIMVPYVVGIREDGKDVGKFVGSVLLASGVGLSLFFLVTITGIKPALSILTRFSPSEIELIYSLFLETSPLLMLLVWTSVLTGTLNAYKIFALPAIAPAFRAAANIAVIYLFKSSLGIHSVAYGYIIGEIFRLMLLLIAVRQMKLFKISLAFNFDRKFINFIKTISYQTISLVAVGFIPLINRTMASWLGPGNVSILEYADRLYAIPVTFISSGILVVILSHWSARFSKYGYDQIESDMKKTLKAVGLIALVIMIGLISFSNIIVKVAFDRGKFLHSNLLSVQQLFVCFLLGFVPQIAAQIIARAYIVLKRTKVLMQGALYMIILNILFNLILMKFFKLIGVALSGVLVSCFAFVFLYLSFKNFANKEAV